MLEKVDFISVVLDMIGGLGIVGLDDLISNLLLAMSTHFSR